MFRFGGTNAIRSAILSIRISHQVAFNIFLSWSQIVLSRITLSNRHDHGNCLIVIFCFISHQVISVICYRAPSCIKRGKEVCFYLKNLMNSGNSSFCIIMDFSEQIFLFNQLKLLPINRNSLYLIMSCRWFKQISWSWKPQDPNLFAVQKFLQMKYPPPPPQENDFVMSCHKIVFFQINYFQLCLPF